jgi:hypothetical protein
MILSYARPKTINEWITFVTDEVSENFEQTVDTDAAIIETFRIIENYRFAGILDIQVKKDMDLTPYQEGVELSVKFNNSMYNDVFFANWYLN